MTLVVYFALTLAATVAAVHLLLPVLRRSAIVDVPGDRTNHKTPTPRGGGLAVVLVLLAAGTLAHLAGLDISNGTPFKPSLLFASVLLLLSVSAFDDVVSLSAGVRILVQSIAIGIAILGLPDRLSVTGGFLPVPLERIGLFFGTLAFVNIYNFMDGIDGITGVETASIALGAAAVHAASGGAVPLLAVLLVAASLGFLVHNWHPARVFLGDVGSVPLGFLCAALLIGLAAQGYLAAALILPAYYLVDGVTTLLDRARKGEKIWLAHSQHAYQRAVRRGLPHDRVAGVVAALNAVLLALAVASVWRPAVSLALALLLAVSAFWALRTGALERG